MSFNAFFFSFSKKDILDVLIFSSFVLAGLTTKAG